MNLPGGKLREVIFGVLEPEGLWRVRVGCFVGFLGRLKDRRKRWFLSWLSFCRRCDGRLLEFERKEMSDLVVVRQDLR